MSDVLDAVNAAFEALFYGSGSWFGILLYLSIVLGLMLKWKYSSVVTIPPTIFIGIGYLTHDPAMPWHALIMWFSSLFLILYMVKQIK
jgi:hypothetical protein